MIEVKHLNKSFDGKQVLYDISATFRHGAVNQIIGKSGSGKTVLMKSIMSLLISINCGMNLSLSIVNKIPLSKTNGIVLLLAQKPLRQITM